MDWTLPIGPTVATPGELYPYRAEQASLLGAWRVGRDPDRELGANTEPSGGAVHARSEVKDLLSVKPVHELVKP